MRNCACDFDEKQLIDRGKAYQTSFFVSLLTVFALFFVTDFLEVPIERRTLFMLALWIPITVCLVLLIFSDAYRGVHTPSWKSSVLSLAMGLDGLVLITLTVIDMVGGGTGPIENGGLTNAAGYLVCGACLVVIGVTYWIKQHDSKRMLGDEDD